MQGLAQGSEVLLPDVYEYLLRVGGVELHIGVGDGDRRCWVE